MDVRSPSPSLPQRRLRSRRRLVSGDKSPEPIGSGSKPPKNWLARGGGWSDVEGENRGVVPTPANSLWGREILCLMGMTRLLQANLNHACRAQDLFLHTLAERDCGLGIVAEPYRSPMGATNWFTDAPPGKGCLAAIVWRSKEGSPPCRMRGRGTGYVVVDWGGGP